MKTVNYKTVESFVWGFQLKPIFLKFRTPLLFWKPTVMKIVIQEYPKVFRPFPVRRDGVVLLKFRLLLLAY